MLSTAVLICTSMAAPLPGEEFLLRFLNDADAPSENGEHSECDVAYEVALNCLDFRVVVEREGNHNSPVFSVLEQAGVAGRVKSLRRAVLVTGYLGSPHIRDLIDNWSKIQDHAARVAIVESCSRFGNESKTETCSISRGSMVLIVSGGDYDSKVQNFLLGLIVDPDSTSLRDSALEALHWFRGPTVLERCKQVLKVHKKLTPGIIQMVVDYLDDCDAKEVVCAAVRDPDVVLRKATAKALASSLSAAAVPFLIILCGDPDSEVARVADDRMKAIARVEESEDRGSFEIWHALHIRNPALFSMSNFNAMSESFDRGVYLRQPKASRTR